MPATLENILQTLVGFIDAFMIAKIGLVAVTAVGLANTILNVYLAVYIALGVAATALVAERIGAKQVELAQTYGVKILQMTTLIGLVLGDISWGLARPFLQLMGADAQVLPQASQFFVWVGGFTLLMGYHTILGTLLRANGDSLTPMKVSLLVNFLNVGLDYLLIFGWGPIPRLGVLGTALGTVISRAIGVLILKVRLDQTSLAFKWRSVLAMQADKTVWQLALPAALERLVMRLGQVLYFSLIVMIGNKTFAAHSIAANIEAFTYMPALGLGSAAAVLVANAMGEGNPQKNRFVTYRCIQYGVGLMTFMGVILYFIAPWAAGLFTQDLEALNQVVTALRIDALGQPVVAISLIMANVLQGMGDTKTPLISTSVGMWAVRVLGVYFLGVILEWGIAGVWWAILIDLSLRSIVLYGRYRQHLTRLESI
ncbi:MATE family efflux transporter [Vaginisenegalia massiliensis]|uniref:MATE family efflux transporter n=1 Tax=Vaginisenegalia massiliensis TaxID=2058294 RepID=UPI0030B92DEA